MLISCFVYDVLRKNINVCSLSNHFVIAVPVRDTRRVKFLKETLYRTKYSQNEPINWGCRIFNEVAHFYDTTVSKEIFKKRARKFFHENCRV